MDTAPTTKVSFSFKAKAKSKPAAVPSAQKPVFASLDDDAAEEDASPSTDSRPRPAQPRSLVPTQPAPTKALKREMERQQKVDATVYQYDEVYDRLKEADRQAELAREEEAKIRQPKYIGNLLQAADQRKRDHLIAEEKLIQREREMEGDEFADKEKFVTQAYKDQLAANRKAEEEEKLREALEKKNQGKKGPGMTHFYETLLKESEKKHAAVIAAASQTVIGPTMAADAAPSLVIKPPMERDLTDLEKARKAQAEGKEVELNDDNQIVDKRALLSAGLNLAAKNTRDLSSYRKEKQSQKEEAAVNHHTAVGTAASRREIEARRKREIEEQLREEEIRRVKEKEREEEELRQRAVKRKNDDDAVMSARERYLERKRRKVENPVAEGME